MAVQLCKHKHFLSVEVQFQHQTQPVAGLSAALLTTDLMFVLQVFGHFYNMAGITDTIEWKDILKMMDNSWVTFSASTDNPNEAEVVDGTKM